MYSHISGVSCILIIVGFKYVFQPNPNRDSCDLSRYQPFIFNTTGYSDCVFLKSHCNSDGQTTHKNGTTRSDRTCTCEAREGYIFVNDPLNKCYCNPTREDCSCYIGNIPNNITGDLFYCFMIHRMLTE